MITERSIQIPQIGTVAEIRSSGRLGATSTLLFLNAGCNYLAKSREQDRLATSFHNSSKSRSDALAVLPSKPAERHFELFTNTSLAISSIKSNTRHTSHSLGLQTRVSDITSNSSTIMSERKSEDGAASIYNENKGGVAVPPMVDEDNREGAVPAAVGEGEHDFTTTPIVSEGEHDSNTTPIVSEGEHEPTTTPIAGDARGTDLASVRIYEPGTDHIEPVKSESETKYEGKGRSRSTLIQCNSCYSTC